MAYGAGAAAAPAVMGAGNATMPFMVPPKPKCGSQGGPKKEYDLPLHVIGLCE
jgi:hypothetical protein